MYHTLAKETFSRHGNDSYLTDTIIFLESNGELYMRHEWDHRGWQGKIRNQREIDLSNLNTPKAILDTINDYIGREIASFPRDLIPSIQEIESWVKNKVS